MHVLAFREVYIYSKKTAISSGTRSHFSRILSAATSSNDSIDDHLPLSLFLYALFPHADDNTSQLVT